MKKQLIAALLITCSLILVALNGRAELGIVAVTQSSQTAEPHKDFTVTIQFSNDSDIELVKLLLCQLEPEFYCESNPIIMTETEDDVYSGTFEVPYENGSTLGYHIMIVYTNGSDVMIPNSLDFLGMDNIVEPATGEFYFSVPVLIGGENNTTQETTLSIPFVSLVAVFIVQKILKHKKRK